MRPCSRAAGGCKVPMDCFWEAIDRQPVDGGTRLGSHVCHGED